ncbi:hypothetical protein K438DRAFT_1885490, partial [Mycena galopus ATCC 62051]
SVVSRISSLRILCASIMLVAPTGLSLTRLSSTTISAAHMEGDMEGKRSLYMWQRPSARQKGKSWCLIVTLLFEFHTYLVRTGMHTTNAPRCSTHVAYPQLPSC